MRRDCDLFLKKSRIQDCFLAELFEIPQNFAVLKVFESKIRGLLKFLIKILLNLKNKSDRMPRWYKSQAINYATTGSATKQNEFTGGELQYINYSWEWPGRVTLINFSHILTQTSFGFKHPPMITEILFRTEIYGA